MAEYGYGRISTVEQNANRQLDAMEALNIPRSNIFTDKQSGKDFNRHQYLNLLEVLRPGDVLYVKSIDRLGRSYDDILSNWFMLTKEREVDIVVIDMPVLDTRVGKDLIGTFLADSILRILSFVAQSERDAIKQRQREGIIAAQKRGVHMGRPHIVLPKNFIELAKQWQAWQLTTKELMEKTGLKKATLYRRLQERGFYKRK